MTLAHREALLKTLARISFRLGDFKLSSGATSDYYIDCRTTTLSGEGGRLTGLAVLDLIREHGCGRVRSGALRSAPTRLSAISPRPAPGMLWKRRDRRCWTAFWSGKRRSPTEPGGASRVSPAGAPVVIVDDVCTTGASTVMAIEAAREAGMRVIGVICLVEREEAKGRPAVEAAAQGRAVFPALQRQRCPRRARQPHGAVKGAPPFALIGYCHLTMTFASPTSRNDTRYPRQAGTSGAPLAWLQQVPTLSRISCETWWRW